MATILEIGGENEKGLPSSSGKLKGKLRFRPP